MDLLDNYMAMDFNPLNIMTNLTSYSFNAKHVYNPQDLHDFITPVSRKQQAPMPAPHDDHPILGSINHYPNNIIVGHDVGNIPNIVIDSHALASHHHHHHHDINHHNHYHPHHHSVMLSSPHDMHYNSNHIGIIMHSPSAATDYNLSRGGITNANNVGVDDDDGDDDTESFREILLDPGMTTEPDDNTNRENVGLPCQRYDPRIELYHQQKYNNGATNNASSNVIIINGDMGMGPGLMTTQSNDHLIHSNNNTHNKDMNEDDHGSNIDDILMLVSRGISIDPIDHMMGYDTAIATHDPTSLSLGNYPNGMSSNGISGNYNPLMGLGDHHAANRNVSVNNSDEARDGSMGFSAGIRSSTICFAPSKEATCMYEDLLMGGINEDTIAPTRRRRSSSSTESSSSSTIISTSAKSDQLSSSSAACIDYATVASLFTPYSRPKKSSRHPLGPALNTNLKPRARQGCASDPQSMAARQRRERINKRLKALQELVPNGSKVDLVTMLEKAINYVKFLQLQLQVLTDDEFWSNPQNLFQSNNDQVVSEEKKIQHGIQSSSPNSTNLVPKVA